MVIRRRSSGRAHALALVCAAGVVSSLAGWGPAALGATGASTPAKDSFSGSTTAATGGLSGARGRVKITLTPGTGQGARHLKLTIRPAACPAYSRCVRLTGKLTGTLTLGPLRVPDIGSRFTIHATGTIKPLGHVSSTGTVSGTGFLARGRESLRLRLIGTGGRITITAHSGLVPGFTSP